MKLNDEVADWVNARPNWQKLAFQEFCSGKTPEDLDYKGLADQLLSDDEITTESIAVDRIPGSTDPDEQVILTSVSNLKGINALIENQTLDFSPSGLTIVFGNNGCGKSGYARLLKETVTTRAQPDEILGNAFTQHESEQAATIQFQVNDSAFSQALFSTESTPLSRIRFYDESCGDLYVKKASPTSYQPSVLALLDKLTTSCELLSAELTERINDCENSRPKLPNTHESTTAAKFLNSLSHNTSTESIELNTTPPDKHEKKTADLLTEVARLKATNSSKEKDRLLQLSRQWTTLAVYAKKITQSLDSSAIKTIGDLATKARTSREAARLASLETFDDQPLSGVGSDTWRALWEAAREFSLTEAYPGQHFPMTDIGKACLLCQQPLTETAANRLRRFETFIANATARDADQHEQEFSSAKTALSKLQILPEEVEQALRDLKTHDEQADDTIAWFSSATALASLFAKWLDGSNSERPAPLNSDAHIRFETLAKQYSTSASRIDVKSFEETLTSTTNELHELQDIKALSESKNELIAEVQRLNHRHKLTEARKQTATNAITKKRSDIVENHVTKDVRQQFANEVEHFGLENVELSRSGRGKSAALDHQPELVGSAPKIRLEQVLSEGEQTVLGLAGFLTEVEFDESKSGVCFDDPVSSLDAERRTKVADRLARLAETRQVVVFTHEITFVHALTRSSDWRQIDVMQRTIQRGPGQAPGLISKGFPWQAQSVGERIELLRKELRDIKDRRNQIDDFEYSSEIGLFAGKLSTALERSISQNIVNQLMDRGSNEIHPRMIRILPQFTREDAIEFDRIYSLVSGWATRHDNSAEENYSPPDINSVESAFEAFAVWDRRIRKYRN